jgi:AbrB family looped-hinge helix DNA binding protein
MKATVSEKGQVTIPKALRNRLGIRPGATLDVREEAGRLVFTKQSNEDAVGGVYGILKMRRRTDRLMNSLRGKPDRVLRRL